MALRRPNDESFNQPSIFFSVANNWTSLAPYRQVTSEFGGLTEVSVMSDLSVYAASGTRVRVGSLAEAASDVADRISLALRRGAIPVQSRVGSASRDGQ